MDSLTKVQKQQRLLTKPVGPKKRLTMSNRYDMGNIICHLGPSWHEQLRISSTAVPAARGLCADDYALRSWGWSFQDMKRGAST